MDEDTRAMLRRIVGAMEDLTREVQRIDKTVIDLENRIIELEAAREETKQ